MRDTKYLRRTRMQRRGLDISVDSASFSPSSSAQVTRDYFFLSPLTFANPPATRSHFLVSGSADNKMRLRSVVGGQVPFPYGGSRRSASVSDNDKRFTLSQMATSDDAGRVSFYMGLRSG